MPCDPLRDLRAWQQRMERLADARHGTAAWTPAVDVYETADRYVVTAELPGLKREEIDLSVENGRLTLRGARHESGDSRQYQQVERGHGQFHRTFEFGATMSPESISAALRDGVLTITLSKVAAPVRTIEVT
jgi:HSP20 family protein